MQCDVHENPGDTGDYAPFLLDIQANLLSDLETRVIVPLVHVRAFGRPASRLHPQLTVNGQRVIMATHLLAAVRRSGIGTRVTSLADQRDVIISAVDVLLSGV